MIDIHPEKLLKEKDLINNLNNAVQPTGMIGANTISSLSWLNLSFNNKKTLIQKINTLQEYTHLPPKGSFTNIMSRIKKNQGRIEILH